MRLGDVRDEYRDRRDRTNDDSIVFWKIYDNYVSRNFEWSYSILEKRDNFAGNNGTLWYSTTGDYCSNRDYGNDM